MKFHMQHERGSYTFFTEISKEPRLTETSNQRFSEKTSSSQNSTEILERRNFN